MIKLVITILYFRPQPTAYAPPPQPAYVPAGQTYATAAAPGRPPQYSGYDAAGHPTYAYNPTPPAPTAARSVSFTSSKTCISPYGTAIVCAYYRRCGVNVYLSLADCSDSSSYSTIPGGTGEANI